MNHKHGLDCRPTFGSRAAREEWGALAGSLVPVAPWASPCETGLLLQDWAEEAAHLLESGLNVAVPAETRIEQGLAAAVLAEALVRGQGRTLGALSRASLGPGQLVQLAVNAPGAVAVAARTLETNGRAYPLGGEARNVLACLTAAGAPVVFVGALGELGRVFHGGPGASHDPLQPAVCRLPPTPLETLIAFAAAQARHEAANVSAISAAAPYRGGV